MTLTEENAAKMFAGELDSTSAYMSGDLKIDGALAGAQKFGTLMQIFQEEFENSKE
jgi:putative sterol carrier protein